MIIEKKDNKGIILIVEDEVIVAIDLKQLLESKGYVVAGTALDSEEAITIAKESKPDLILMDVMLKGDKDGIETAALINSFMNVPVLFLTAYSDVDTINRVKKVNPYGYIIKPYDEKELIIAIEISLYKHSIQKRLVESEKLYRRIVDDSPVGMLMVNLKQELVYVNKAFENFIGYSAQEIIGRKIKDITYDEDKEIGQPELKKIVSGELDNSQVEKRYLKKDGSIVWGQVDIHLIRDNENKPMYFLPIIQDITARKNAQIQLLASELTYENMINSVGEAIFIQDQNGKIINVNSTAENMFGYSKIDFIGQTHEILSVPGKNDLESIKFMIAEAFDGKPNRFEFWGLRKSGSMFPVEVSLNLFDYFQKKAVISVCRDISERKKAEHVLRENSERLRVVINATPDIICFKDAFGRWIQANKSMLDLFHLNGVDYYNKTELEISSYTDELFKEAFKNSKITDERAWELGQMSRAVEIIPDINKKSRVFDVVKIPLFNEDLSRRGLVVFGRDITEMKKVEDALRQSEQNYREIFNSTNESILILDIAGNIIDVNEPMLRMYVYDDKHEILSTGFGNICNKESSHNGEEIEVNLRNAIEKGPQIFEWLAARKTGEKMPVEISLKSTSIGGEGRVLAVVRDISERKRTEKAIRESEEKFRISFLTSPDSININRIKDGLFLEINEGFTQITGYTKKDVENKTSLEVNIWANAEDRKKLVQELFTRGVCQNLLAEFRMKDGTIKTGLMSASIIHFGNEDCILSITRDMTEKVKHERELNEYRMHLEELVDQRAQQIKKQNTFLRTLIDTIPNPIFVKDTQGRYTEVNKAFEKFYDISRDEIIGKTLAYIAPKDVIEQNNMYEAKLLAEHSSIVYETYYIDKNGNRVDLLLHKASFGDINGKPEGLTGLVVDISKQKEMEMKTRDALEKEKELNAMKTGFISTASHEFRTPLSTILTSADLLQMNFQKWNDEKILKHINRIQESVDYMTILLEDILTLSRSDRGKLVLTPVDVNLYELCLEILEQVKLQAKEHHKFYYYYSAPSVVYNADPKLITHILTNLLTNSVKFSPSGGNITLNVDKEDMFIKFVISDDGIGIPGADLNKLFEPFFRSDNAANIKGSGLGMSIVKRAVEIHQGNITVESKVGEGSIFTIKIRTA